MPVEMKLVVIRALQREMVNLYLKKRLLPAGAAFW